MLYSNIIGRKFSDIKNNASNIPPNIISRDGMPFFNISIDGKYDTISPVEAYAAILGEMKDIAQDFLGHGPYDGIYDAVITVPNYFTVSFSSF